MTRLNVVHEWFEMGFQFEAAPDPEQTIRTERALDVTLSAAQNLK
jgi:hypothetical protein